MRRAQKETMRKKYNQGQSTVELVTGLTVMVPVVLCLLNVMTIVLIASENEKVARNVARMCATQDSRLAAQVAAKTTVRESRRPGLAKTLELKDLDFRPQRGDVEAFVTMTARLPVPLAGWEEITITSSATEPILSFLEKGEEGNQ